MSVSNHKIKVHYTKFWPGFDGEEFLFTQLLKKKYNVEIVGGCDSPDIVFFSVFFVEMQPGEYIRVFYTGENSQLGQILNDERIINENNLFPSANFIYNLKKEKNLRLAY